MGWGQMCWFNYVFLQYQYLSIRNANSIVLHADIEDKLVYLKHQTSNDGNSSLPILIQVTDVVNMQFPPRLECHPMPKKEKYGLQYFSAALKQKRTTFPETMFVCPQLCTVSGNDVNEADISKLRTTSYGANIRDKCTFKLDAHR